MELTYTERNGIMYPDLSFPKQSNYPIGKYGRMRLDYLKKHRRGTYTTLLTSCTLNQHLYETEQEAKRLIDLTLSLLVNEHSITEELKATNPLIKKASIEIDSDIEVIKNGIGYPYLRKSLYYA